MNKDDSKREKTLTWKKNEGWMSDDSDDEEMKFKRFIKFEKRKQVEKYGDASFH